MPLLLCSKWYCSCLPSVLWRWIITIRSNYSPVISTPPQVPKSICIPFHLIFGFHSPRQYLHCLLFTPSFWSPFLDSCHDFILPHCQHHPFNLMLMNGWHDTHINSSWPCCHTCTHLTEQTLVILIYIISSWTKSEDWADMSFTHQPIYTHLKRFVHRCHGKVLTSA